MTSTAAGALPRPARNASTHLGRGVALLWRAVTVALLLAWAGLVAGCSDQAPSPLSADSAQAAEVRGIPAEAFEPLRLQAGPLPAGKRVGAALVVRASKGGTVKAKWEIEGDDEEVKIEAEIKIRPGALERDTRISIELEGPADVTFVLGECGTRFSVPAELSLKVKGLDLPDGDDPAGIDLFWLDEEAGVWVPVPRQSLKVGGDKLWGTWLLDHFSRYSLSGGGAG